MVRGKESVHFTRYIPREASPGSEYWRNSRLRGDPQNWAETNLSSKVKNGLVPTNLRSLPVLISLSDSN